jgi:hypothetical protein
MVSAAAPSDVFFIFERLRHPMIPEVPHEQ